MSRKIVLFSAAVIATLAAGVLLLLPYLHHPETMAVVGARPARAAQPSANWPAVSHRFAGTGERGFADGSSLAAQFSDPYGLARDAAGNIYVSDAGDNNLIRKIAADGTVGTIAGHNEGFIDGVGRAASFNTPSGLAIDHAGNIYVADTGNNAIRKIDTQGKVTTLAGDGQAGWRDGPGAQARFNGPLGLDVDQHGNIYVADTYNDRVRRIAPDGTVSTLAGDAAGFQDGHAAAALFDTPANVLLDARGDLIVADTHNNALRKLTLSGKQDQVITLARSLPEEHDALLRRPTGLAWGDDGVLYISDSTRGRILRMLPGGEIDTLPSAALQGAANAADITDFSLRLARPTALLATHGGGLLVAAAGRYQLDALAPPRAGEVAPDTSLRDARQTTQAARHMAENLGGAKADAFPWPFKPQRQAREIVGTLGEVRGSYDGASRDHLHGGLDVQAAMGSMILAVADEKVSDPVATWAFDKLGEGLCVDAFCYIHMRVGRTAEGKIIDPARFLVQEDANGKPAYVRVKRGTRFAVGDALGSVNRMYHVHLALIVGGAEINPLLLPFSAMRDDIAPTIRQVQVVDQDGRAYDRNEHGRLLLPAGGKFSIVAEAYDQMNGNEKRRQLGLFHAGYQVLKSDGKPLAGFEQPLINMDFLFLPDDPAAVKIAYAASSGITVYGSEITRMRYEVTNRVRDGLAERSTWDSSGMAPGDYLIRIYATDFAGNIALTGRDLPIRLAQ